MRKVSGMKDRLTNLEARFAQSLQLSGPDRVGGGVVLWTPPPSTPYFLNFSATFSLDGNNKKVYIKASEKFKIKLLNRFQEPEFRKDMKTI